MKNFQKILDSFSVKKTLNPKVWENPEDPKKATLKKNIRTKLLKIAEEFSDELGEDIFITDIHLMGSLANFNWSEYSDFDLHLLVDFESLSENEELYKELFDLKKDAFNDKHDIKIYGFDVEVYAQDSEENKFSEGIYSVMYDEWINIPPKEHRNIDMELLKTKIKTWTSKIDKALEDAKEGNDGKKLKELKNKIKEYRKSGLEKEGELSYENLVFKYLRRSGYIGKLFDLKTKLKDKSLSIERKIEESI
jgi:predicted nucleotidyltransferase